MRSRYSSFIALICIALIYILSLISYGTYKHDMLGGGDSFGYYAYLPATFIYHDLDSLNHTLAARIKYRKNYQKCNDNWLGICEVHSTDKGKIVIKYTMGVAMLNLPAFALAHTTAWLWGKPTDGWTFPYIFFIHLSSFCWAMLGLYYLRKTLLRYFDDSIVCLTLLAVALATNLYYFTVYNGAMAHSYLFALYSILIWNTICWYNTFRLRHALVIGFACGMISLIRPVEIIAALIPLSYGIVSISSFKARLSIIFKHWKAYFAAFIVAFLVCFPQLLYWHWLTGSWVHYSYGSEGFNFKDPHLYMGLLGYANGWLIYTPIMWLALGGIAWLLISNKRTWLLPILLFIPLHIYIAYSWWCYNYINGFGSRPMVETYALLAIPLAYMLNGLYLSARSAWIPVSALILFSAINLFNTYQHNLGVLWSQDANRDYYWSVFGKTRIDYDDLVAFDTGEAQPTTSLEKIKDLYYNDFEDSTDVNTVTDVVWKGKRAYRLTKSTQYSPGLNTILKDTGIQHGDWLRIKMHCLVKAQTGSYDAMNVLAASFEREGQAASLQWRNIRLENKLRRRQFSSWNGNVDEWHEVEFYTKVPPHINCQTDYLKVFAINYNGNDVFMDDLSVQIWRENE